MEEQHTPPTTTTSTTSPLLLLRRRRRVKNSLTSEISGAVGDLGTFIPIVLTLTLVSNLDLSTTLIFTSLYNIATGLLFGLPMPVQPMKSIAAVAVSESPHLTQSQIATAGLTTAATLLFLGCTGLMSFFYRFIPLPVVRGVQLSQGLSFAFSAIKYIRYNQDFVTSTKTSATIPRPWLGLDGLLLAISAVLFLVLTTGSGDYNVDNNDSEDESDNVPLNRSRHRLHKRLRILSAIPAALIVFLLGLFLCFIRDPTIFNDLKFGPSKFKVLKFTWEDWKIGFFRAAIPQIPLSVLNSVIAVCKLSGDLFPDREELSVTRVSISVGVMNFVGCWFGAMPVCHGAGGAKNHMFQILEACSSQFSTLNQSAEMASSTAFSTSPPFLSNTNITTTSNRILSHINLGSHSTHLFSNARRGKLIRTSISAKQGNKNPLQYRKLGDSDLQISEITLGTMTFGEQNTEKEAHEMLSYAFEHGINILDTAESHPTPMKKETQGKTDLYISSWLNSQPRDKVIIATKVCGYSERSTYMRDNATVLRVDAANIKESVEKSLKRLNTDYIDLLQIHWPDRYVALFGEFTYDYSKWRPSVPFAEQLRAFKELIDEGKVRHIGVSSETSYGVMEFVHAAKVEGLPKIVSIQHSYSLLVRCRFEVDLVEVCHPNNCNIGLLAYSPLGGGLLSGKYLDINSEAARKGRLNLFPGYVERYNISIAKEATIKYMEVAKKHGLTPVQLALGFARDRPFMTSSIIGATSVEQLKEDIDAFVTTERPLPQEVMADIESVFKRYKDPDRF